MEPDINKHSSKQLDRRLTGGVLLILLGGAVLLQRWFNIGMYMALLLGSLLLAWGCLARRKGLIIPGGVLTGIGLGILALEGPWQIPAELESGVFLLCFACGWFLIALLTALFTCTQWWALIPGSIMAVIGGSILVTHGAIHWEDLNLVYAAALICVGLVLIVYRGRSSRNE